MTISSASRRWELGKPFPIQVRIQNNSPKPIVIATYGGGERPYFSMLVLDFELTWLNGKERVPIRLFRPWAAIRDLPSSEPQRLRPGKVWETTVDFNNWLPITKEVLMEGSYELRAVWNAQSPLGDEPNIQGVAEDLYSNPLPLTLGDN